MKKEDIFLLLLAICLLLAMLITFIFGGATSRHGVGKSEEDLHTTPLITCSN